MRGEPRKVHRPGFHISRQGRPREFITFQGSTFFRKITVRQNYAIAERTFHATAKNRSTTDEASVLTRKIRPPNHDPLKIAFSLINRRGWNQHYYTAAMVHSKRIIILRLSFSAWPSYGGSVDSHFRARDMS